LVAHAPRNVSDVYIHNFQLVKKNVSYNTFLGFNSL